MGKRVHVIAKHQEYGDSASFNWKCSEFHDFLDSLGAEVSPEDEYADEFECQCVEYKKALDLLKKYKKKGAKAISNELEGLGYSPDDLEKDLAELGGIDYVLSEMCNFYNERDKKSDWISFSAW